MAAKETGLFKRIAAALERLAPAAIAAAAPAKGDAFVWEPGHGGLISPGRVAERAACPAQGIDGARDTLFENTRRFAQGLPANNALLWGARAAWARARWSRRCMPRSTARPSRAKASSWSRFIARKSQPCPPCCASCAPTARRFLLYCDDLSSTRDDTSYKSLKAALEGGIEGRPANVLLYATSNRRHLMPREMMENERSTAINPSEAVEEKVSLSDRFGLWLGFHNCSQDEYLAMVDGYAQHYRLAVDGLHARALAWSKHPRQPLRPRRLAVHPGRRGGDGEEVVASRHPSRLASFAMLRTLAPQDDDFRKPCILKKARHPEVRAKRASKGDAPALQLAALIRSHHDASRQQRLGIDRGACRGGSRNGVAARRRRRSPPAVAITCPATTLSARLTRMELTCA